MIKKYKKLIASVLILACVYTVDFALVSYDKRPIFVLPTATVKDGGTRQYYGLGYKVIGWKRLSAKLIDGKEVQGRLTGCEISIFPYFQDINDGPKKDLKFVANN
jgi:hypothetical protein